MRSIETWFDTARGEMVQVLSDRVQLVANLKTGVVVIRKDDVMQLLFENPRVSDMAWIQSKAMELELKI